MKKLLLAVSLFALPALAMDFEGVTSPDEVTVEGKSLKLNGMGLRQKFVFKVYVASLYLENKTSNANDILKGDEIRRVELKMLRDLDKKAIVDAVREGFDKNSGAQAAALKERLDAFCDKLVDLKKGQVLQIQYVPGKGTSVSAGAQTHNTTGKDFADALFAVWLGGKPADEGLKKGLLATK
ncbi:MAG TPA: chalcone isomerase family protein [Archangium sp.]